MNASYTLARLRRNDPNAKFVYVQLREEEDIALAEALETNEYVNDIRFMVGQTEQQQQPLLQRWDNLLRVLATREKLEKVQLEGSFQRGAHRPPITSVEISILRAVQTESLRPNSGINRV